MKPRLGPVRDAMRRHLFRLRERTRWSMSAACLSASLWLEEGVANRVERNGGEVARLDRGAVVVAEWLEALADQLVPEFASPKPRPRIERAPDERGPGDLSFLNLPDGVVAELVLAEAGMTHEVTV